MSLSRTEPSRPLGDDASVAEDELRRLRQDIDVLNLQLLRLLERRGELVLRIARLKERHGMTMLDAGRETTMVGDLAAQSRGLYDRHEIETIFRRIFAASRSLAQRLTARTPKP